MINQALLERLHQKYIIHKPSILWWQLGFEGRKIISQEEFDTSLQTEKYSCLTNFHELNNGEAQTPLFEEKTFKVWPRDDVPIVIKKIILEGEEVDTFVTINPMSHWSGGETGWRELKCNKEDDLLRLPLSTYRTPHIRGIVVEQTPEFLFWNPITLGMSKSTMFTRAWSYKDIEEPFMITPVNSSTFYHNLIRRVWRGGKRPQKKALELDVEQEGLTFVPYYLFDPSQNNVTLYPSSVFPGKLDLPTVIRGNPHTSRPEIVGVGSISHRGNNRFEEWGKYSASYWKLSTEQLRTAKESLVRRLGRVC